jgi:hypothetical protein
MPTMDDNKLGASRMTSIAMPGLIRSYTALRPYADEHLAELVDES